MRPTAVVALAFGGLACAPALPEAVPPFTRTPDAEFRSRPPASTRGARPLRLPAIAENVLANGLRVWILPRPDLPLVTLAICVRGAGLEGTGSEPAASWIAAVALAEADGDGIRAAVGRDGVELSITREASAFEGAARALSEVVQRPNFSPEHVAEARRAVLASIGAESRLHAPEALIANELLYRYPPPTVLGAMVSDAALGSEQLVAVHRARYRPSESALVIVGAVDTERAREVAHALFGEWQPAAPPTEAPQRDPLALLPSGSLRPVGALHRPIVEAHARVTIPGPPPEHPDFPAFDAARARFARNSATLDGEPLRPDFGAHPTVRAELREYELSSEIVLEFSARPLRLVETTRQVLAEIERLRERPLPAGETTFLTVVWQSRLAAELVRNEGTAALLARRFLLGRDSPDLESVVRRSAAVTPEAIQHMARTWLRPERIQLVVTGDQGRLESQVAELGGVVWFGL